MEHSSNLPNKLKLLKHLPLSESMVQISDRALIGEARWGPQRMGDDRELKVA